MNRTIDLPGIISWMFGTVLIVTGVLNIMLVHPVPGIAYFLLSLVYFPPVNVLQRKMLGFSVPTIIKIILAIAIIMFTLGVSDLGDMIDKM